MYIGPFAEMWYIKIATVKSPIESGLYLEIVILSEDCNQVGTVFESGLYFFVALFENIFKLCSRHKTFHQPTFFHLVTYKKHTTKYLFRSMDFILHTYLGLY